VIGLYTIVVVPKLNGTGCTCGDYKVTVNPVPISYMDQYTMLKAENLFATLASGQKLANWICHMHNHLSFGIVSASTIVQQMEKIVQGLPCVTCIDNIHITGCSDEEHLETLEKVLITLNEYGLCLKREKNSLMQPSLEYIGYIMVSTLHQ